MPLSFLFSVVVLISLINIGHCSGTEQDVKLNEDVYKDLTDRELVLALVRRIDDLERWNHKHQKENDYLQATNQKQQKEIDYLQGTNLNMEMRMTDMESLLKRAFKPMESMKNPETHQNDFLSYSSTGEFVLAHQVPMFREQGQVVKKPQHEKQISRRQSDEHKRVAFYAKLTNHLINLGINQAVEFKTVITNIGNAYNLHTGVFTAPFDGTYVFSVTLMAHTRDDNYYKFVKNGAQIGRINTRGIESPYSTSSYTFVLQLRMNDDVEIRNVDADQDLHGNEFSSFSGFLLYPDEEPDVIVG